MSQPKAPPLIPLTGIEIPFYGRRSRVDRVADRTSVEKQDDRCRRLIMAEGGIPKGFLDAKGHRSGRYEHTRPGWLEFKSHVMTFKPPAVVFYKLDRMSRGVNKGSEFIEWCMDNNIRIISIIDRIDTAKNVGANEIARIHRLLVDAQEESDIARERSIDNISFLRENGVPWGYPNSGYTRVGEGLEARYEPDEEAPNIPVLFEWFNAGTSYRDVLQRATSAGMLHKNRDNQWEPYRLGVIQSILNDALAYAGFLKLKNYHSHRGKVVLEGEGTHLERFARAMSAVKTDHIVPLLTEDQADKAIVRRLKSQRGGRKTENWLGMLQPLIRVDGRPVYCQTRKGVHVYRVRGAGSRTFAGDAIDNTLLFHLKALSPMREMRDTIRVYLARMDTDTLRAGSRERLKSLKGQLGRTKDMFADGFIDRPEFEKRFRDINDEIHRISQVLAVPSEADALLVNLTTIGETLERLNGVHRRNAVAHLIESVDLSDEGEISRIELKKWARHAFGHVASAWRNCALDRCLSNSCATADVSFQWLEGRVAA